MAAKTAKAKPQTNIKISDDMILDDQSAKTLPRTSSIEKLNSQYNQSNMQQQNLVQILQGQIQSLQNQFNQLQQESKFQSDQFKKMETLAVQIKQELKEMGDQQVATSKDLCVVVDENKAHNTRLNELFELFSALPQRIDNLEQFSGKAQEIAERTQKKTGSKIAVYFLSNALAYKQIILDELNRMDVNYLFEESSTFKEAASLHLYVTVMATRLTDLLPTDWVDNYIKRSPNSILLAIRATNLVSSIPNILDSPKEYQGLFKIVLQMVTSVYTNSMAPSIQICQQNVINKQLLIDVIKNVFGNEKTTLANNKPPNCLVM